LVALWAEISAVELVIRSVDLKVVDSDLWTAVMRVESMVEVWA
jgi:hypothetical protein